MKAIHTGFSGPATGGDNLELRKETVTLVEKLLAEEERAANVSGAKQAPVSSLPKFRIYATSQP